MERFENWMSYSFDDIEFGIKTKNTKNFKINFNKKIQQPLPTYKDALYNNAILMRENYAEPFDVCLSGGSDSEVVVRVFKDLKIKHNTFIFRLEDDLNYRDVQNAISLCHQLNIPYSVIDFNMRKFFENEAYDLFSKYLTTCVFSLARIKWFDFLDNIPIFGEGEPYLKRQLEADYSCKSSWIYDMSESVYSYSIAAKRMNRIAIGDWYEYTPHILLSSFQLPIIKSLVNDEIPGKLSNRSSKSLMHNHIWPEMQYKPKLIGYEGHGEQGTYPDYIKEFERHLSSVSDTEIWYSTSQLENFLLDVNK
jgi:hypothetical protein